jgi:conjugative transfer signal peptidase TraF
MTGRVIVLGTVAMAVAAIGTTMVAEMTPRFVWNASASVPIGLYSVHPADHLTVTALAVAYPPEPLAGWLAQGRYLPRGVPLIKPILALDGQTVCRVGPLITVDGRETGVAHDKDHSGRPLPFWQGCHVIRHSEIFLMNPYEPASLDGRYFGPLPIASIAGLAEPLWTSAQDRPCGLNAAPIPDHPRFDHAYRPVCLPGLPLSR